MSKELDNELNKLREQLKLLEELNKLKNSQVDSANRYQNVQEKINKMVELRTKLEQQGLKTSQYLDDVEEKLLKVKTKLNELEDGLLNTEKEREKVNKNISETKKETSKIDKEQIVDLDKIYDKELGRLQNLGTTKGLEEDILEAKRIQLDFIRDAELSGKRISDEEKKRLVFENEKVKSLEKQKKLREQEERKQNKSSESIKQSLDNINIPGLGKVSSVKQYSELSTSAKLISVAADTFNEAVGKFTSLFTGGLNRIADKANSQFQGISVQSGMSYSTYRSGVGGMNSTLKNWNGYNLQDNIRTSDVQDMMSKLANTGMGQEQLFASAIDTVLTKEIVPYLELSTTEMQQFNRNTNGELLKQVRGIAKVNQEMFNDNSVATKYLQEQLNYLEPMSAVAELDLIQNSEEMMGYYQGLKEQGLSDSQIAKEISKVRRIQDDASGVLQNGSLDEQLAVIYGEQAGIDFTTDSFGVAKTYGKSVSQLSGMGPSSGGLNTYIYGNAVGLGGRGQAMYGRLGLDRDKAAEDAAEAGRRLKEAGNDATQNFANGGNQTKLQKQEITMENLSSEFAMIKTDMGVWFDVLTTAVKGIASILLAWAAGKAISGIGGKLLGGGAGKALGGLSGAGTYLNAGLQQGFMKGSTTAVGSKFGAQHLGFMQSTGGAVAGGLGIAAGGAMAIKGTSDVISDFKEGDVNAGTAMSGVGAAGGAVGAGALLALGASNPIGWVALAIGGAAMLGRELYESANSYKEAGKKLSKEWDKFGYEMEEEIRLREKSLMTAEDYLKNDEDTEKARAELINSGMLSEEDMQKAQSASREELIKLTEQYKTSTSELKGISKEMINELKGKQSGEINESVKSIQDWIYGEASSNYNEANLNMLRDLRNKTVAAIEAKGDSASSDEKEYLKRVNKNKGKNKNGQADILWEFKEWDDGKKAIATALGGEDIEELTGYAKQLGIGGIKEYNNVSKEEATDLFTRLNQASSKEEVESVIKTLKEWGFNDLDSLPTETKTAVSTRMQKYGASYRVGIDSIPYDNYPAMLHEGEAVLTASTANELRGLVDEYRETKNESTRLEKALQDQTAALVQRLDAIYQKMPSNGETQAQAIMPGRLEQNTRNMTSAFNQFS